MKTARSLVAKVEYEVVEMMVKLWRLMGHLGGKEEEEDDGGGGVVVEMEERMMVGFEVKMKEKWWRMEEQKWMAKASFMAAFLGLLAAKLSGNREGRKVKE